MRDIKFRAWDKVDKRYDKNHHLRLDMDGVVFNLQTGAGGDEYKLEQYTGLKDKNGKEVYEGDIIKFSEHSYLAEVKYYPEFGAFLFDSKDERTRNNPECSMCWTDEIEIIGTIHDMENKCTD